MQIPTVKIVMDDGYADGYMVINKDDFDESVHEIFESDLVVANPSPENPIDSMMKKDLVVALGDANVEFNKNLGVKKMRILLAEAIEAQAIENA